MNWKQKQEREKEALRIAEFYSSGDEPQVVPGVRRCILKIAHEGEHLYAEVPSNFWRCDKVKKETK